MFLHMQGKLIAGINSKVQLYKWIQTEDGSRELQIECSHTGHVLVLFVVTRGDFVIVGEKFGSTISTSPSEASCSTPAWTGIVF